MGWITGLLSNSLVQKIAGGIIRAGLVAVGATLVHKGWLTSDAANTDVGAAMVLLASAWSVTNKVGAHAQVSAQKDVIASQAQVIQAQQGTMQPIPNPSALPGANINDSDPS